jgi:ATP-dependent protease ClpP protease subunit
MCINKKTLFFNYCAPIDSEPFMDFEAFMNDAIIKNRNAIIYFTTNGGSMSLSQNMIEMINNFPNDIRIVVTGYCYSAGLYVITNVKCPVEIKAATSGMAHFPYTDLNSKALKDEDSWDYFQLATEKEFIEEYLRNIKQILTEKEIEKIMDGKEVWLKTDRMIELVNSLKM